MMEILPFVGLDNINFGMLRKDVRELLGDNWREFRKTPFSKNLTDSYDSLGLHLYYDEKDCLEFIEAFSPCSIIFKTVSLVGSNLNEVLSELKKQNISGRLDEPSWFFDSSGFALIENEGVVTGVSIFCKGYYG
jgi:hypothetical protein